MLTGYTPFRDKTEYLIFKKILDGCLNFPENFPPDAKDLISKLLVIDPSKRLGANLDYTSLRNHQFFKGLDFDNLDEMEPPFKKFLKVKFSIRQKTFKNEDIPKENITEKVMKEGFVYKRDGHSSHFNKRKLVLYNTQKIEYIDALKNVIKVRKCVNR